MRNRKAWFIGSLIILITTSILLITGSSILTLSLAKDSNVPLGTFITWIGFISLPMTLLLGIKRLENPKESKNKIMANALKTCIVLSILWVPISYFLAGNISFTFTEKAEFRGGQLAMNLFWYYNYFLVGAPLLLIGIYKIISLFKKH